MKIYSWNIFFRNGKLERAFKFIKELDYDVLCLQEVPEEFLDKLRKLPVHIAFAPDVDRIYPERIERNFLVILSRHPIVAHSAFALEVPFQPLRTRLFAKAMRPIYWSRVRNRHGFFADIQIEELPTPVRVFCLHLTLAHPEARRREFEIAMREYDATLPTIVCGDFNILDTPLVAPFNWLLGGRVSDALRYQRERAQFEERIARLGLANPLNGKRTHLISGQLDHILISQNLSIESAHVVSERIGSDHYPIHVEIDIEMPYLAEKLETESLQQKVVRM
ncbi:endonuclease/exonuclease/phosphatase family protein [Candidatus Kaiserbacteria bacterium]|nr:endonuclease/exonuclease/phosphatase family protein [Candidatus Kaiserbacteria bacterium]